MRISAAKKEKISEQVLSILYSRSPTPIFITYIAQETARDEEFIKKILFELKKNNLVTEVKKNPKGIDYKARSRWKMSDQAYMAYKKKLMD